MTYGLKEANQSVPAGVAKKLFLAQGRLNYVEKEGKVTGFASYSYAKAEDFFHAVKDVCQEIGLIFVVSYDGVEFEKVEITKNQATRTEFHSRLLGIITLIDPDTGESWTVPGFYMGEGADSGDKAPYKAMTGAAKYGLRGVFGIAMTDDPEKFDGKEEPEKKGGQKVEKKVADGDKPAIEVKKDFSSWSGLYGYVDSLPKAKELRDQIREINKAKDKTAQQVAEALKL